MSNKYTGYVVHSPKNHMNIQPTAAMPRKLTREQDEFICNILIYIHYWHNNPQLVTIPRNIFNPNNIPDIKELPKYYETKKYGFIDIHWLHEIFNRGVYGIYNEKKYLNSLRDWYKEQIYPIVKGE